MKRILTALVLIPLVLALVFLKPAWQWVFTCAAAGVALLAAWEFLDLAKQGGVKAPRVSILVAIVALFAAVYEWPDQITAILGFLSLGLLVYCTFRSDIERVLPDASVSIFCLIYTGFTLISVPALRAESNGPSLVTFLLCVVWAGDIAALYIGRAWGRHKLAPTISPNKTWEGTLGSMAGSLLAAGALLGLATLLQTWNSAALSYPEEAWYWLVLAAIVGVKDSGSLLPGHGGVLDRIDALLLAAPVLWYAQIIHQRF
jgi:phosphatidate cytidylyltransferase